MEKLSKENATSKTPMLQKEKNLLKEKKKIKNNAQSRDPFFRRLFGRLNNKKERAKVRQNLGRGASNLRTARPKVRQNLGKAAAGNDVFA